MGLLRLNNLEAEERVHPGEGSGVLAAPQAGQPE